MAEQQIGNLHGFPTVGTAGGQVKTNLGNINAVTDAGGSWWSANYNNITAMRTRLAAIDAGFYTAARLNTMTYNDMLFALRVADAPTTIKQ